MCKTTQEKCSTGELKKKKAILKLRTTNKMLLPTKCANVYLSGNTLPLIKTDLELIRANLF